MKKAKVFFAALLALALSVPPAYAGGIRIIDNGTLYAEATEIECSGGISCPKTTGSRAAFTATAGAFVGSTLTSNAVDAANSIWGVSNGMAFEGATANAHELTVSPQSDPTADVTVSVPSLTAGALMLSALTSNDVDVANSIWGVSNGLAFEGATADAFELTLSPADVGADATATLPNMAASYAVFASLLTTNAADIVNSVWGVSNGIAFEGATADAFELTLAPANVAADATATLPDNGASYAVIGSLLTTNAADVANSVWGVSAGLNFEGSAADTSEGTLTATNPTADRTYTLPDQTGTVLLAGAATALTPGAAVSLTVAPGNRLYTLTTNDNEDTTITFSGAGSAGDMVTIIFTTSSTGDEVVTFHTTLVNSVGTLTLGTTAARFYTVRFVSDGTAWNEISRTAEQS